MADYTVTPANVLASVKAVRFQPSTIFPVSILATSARPHINAAGAVITAGMPIYQDPTTLAFYPADANQPDPIYKVIGMAENSAAIGQPISIIVSDPNYTPGCTMVIGDMIVLSASPGAICPASDIASGMFAAFLMVAYSTTQARLSIVRADVVKP